MYSFFYIGIWFLLVLVLIWIRLANRFFQNNWIFLISISVSKPLFIIFQFFFSKEYKIFCISDCLQKGLNSAKSDCLVSTKNVTSSRNLEQLSMVPKKMTNTSLRDRDSTKYRLDLDSACLKTLEQLLFWPNYCWMRDIALTSSCPPLFIVAYKNW